MWVLGARSVPGSSFPPSSSTSFICVAPRCSYYYGYTPRESVRHAPDTRSIASPPRHNDTAASALPALQGSSSMCVGRCHELVLAGVLYQGVDESVVVASARTLGEKRPSAGCFSVRFRAGSGVVSVRQDGWRRSRPGRR